MCNIICVTNRKLCKEDFLERIEKIAMAGPKAIVLREKDLSLDEYECLAKRVVDICDKYNIECILHYYSEVAKRLNVKSIHLPMFLLKDMSKKDLDFFDNIGASCHSAEEAIEAERRGCTYIFAGHVFETDCKKDIPPRGEEFLKKVCSSVNIPVFGIGGISADNYHKIISAGAKGGCIMSGFMTCNNPSDIIKGVNYDF